MRGSCARLFFIFGMEIHFLKNRISKFCFIGNCAFGKNIPSPRILSKKNENAMTLIDQIRDLIAEGETQRSLDELYKYVKENNADVIDNLVMLRSRMQNVQRAVHNGTMDDHAAAMERAKINEAILKLLPQLTPEYLAQATKKREPVWRDDEAPRARTAAAPATDMKKWYLIGGGALLVVILLIVMLSGGGGSEETQTQTEQTTQPQQDFQQQEQQDFQQQEQQTNQVEEDLSARWQSADGEFSVVTQDGTNWQMVDNRGNAQSGYKLVQSSDEYVILSFHGNQGGGLIKLTADQLLYQEDGETDWTVSTTGGWVGQ